MNKWVSVLVFLVISSFMMSDSFAIRKIQGKAVNSVDAIAEALECTDGDFQFVKESEVIKSSAETGLVWDQMDCTISNQRCYVTDGGGGIAFDVVGGRPLPNIWWIDINTSPIRIRKTNTYGCNLFFGLGCAIQFKHTFIEPPPALSRNCNDTEIRCNAPEQIITSDSPFGDFRSTIYAMTNLEGGPVRRMGLSEMNGDLRIGSPEITIPTGEVIARLGIALTSGTLGYDPFIGLQGRTYVMSTLFGAPSSAQFASLDVVGVGLVLNNVTLRTMGNNSSIPTGGMAVEYVTELDELGNPKDGSFYIGENFGNSSIYRQKSDLTALESVVHGQSSINKLRYDNVFLELYVCGGDRIQVYTNDLTFKRQSALIQCLSIDVDYVSDKVYIIGSSLIRRLDRLTLALEDSFDVDTTRGEVQLRVDPFSQKAYVLSRDAITTNTAALAKIDLCSSF